MSKGKTDMGLTYFDQFNLSMSSLQTTYHNICAANGVKSLHLELHEDPEIWSEFSNRNRVVNKKNTPICAIGPDHALAQINSWMKVSGGLFGITLNKIQEINSS